MSENTITLKLTNEESSRLYNAYNENAVPVTSAYMQYQLRVENCVITAYTSGKVVFQGKDASVYAAAFQQPTQPADTNTHAITYPHAGSDEVGTGDYFGPVCVCACIVKEEDLPLLRELQIQDSKQITDEHIVKVAPKLMDQIEHSLLIVNNQKYNDIHDRYNMNAIKALLHNQAYYNLSHRTTLPDLIVIDQFTPEASYYRYLKYEQNVIRNIHFETKAENKYPAVATASVIARYAFLKVMEQMDTQYNMHFVKGASDAVDACGVEFVQKYGFEQLQNVAKLHFKNTEKIQTLISKD